MKKLFAVLLALCTSVTLAATTIPVQMFNPTGSSSGQAIVSTGASTAPAWGGVGVNGIAPIAANTVLVNATAASASPTAFAMPSCSTSASALIWTTSTGFTCNTAVNAAQLGGVAASSYALLASPALTGTPTAPTATTGTSTAQLATTAFIGNTLAASPVITTPNLIGRTNGTNAPAGSVGQPLTATGTNVSLTNNTAANCTSIPLTAGDWDVWGEIYYAPAGTTVPSGYQAGISTTSATQPAIPLYSTINITFGAGQPYATPVPMQIINVSSSTTVYLVATAAFTTSTMTATCTLVARRMS